LDRDGPVNEKAYRIVEKQPRLTVACLSMNHARFIERSCRSVLDQTYRDFEIIYLDNNSTDGTFEIADKIFRESGMPYTSYRRTENYGVAENVNFLWRLSKREYVAVLSGDDFWEPNNLELKIKYYDQHPEFGMLYGGGYKYFYDTGKAELMNDPRWKSGWIFKDLLKGNFINGIGILFKKSTLDDVGLFDEQSLVEDWDLWLRIAEKYPIGFIPDPLSYYGQQTGNNTSSNTSYMDKGVVYIFDKYAHHPEIEKAKNSYWLYRVYERASGKPSWQDMKFILKNFQFNPVYFKQLVKAAYNFFFGRTGK